MKSGNWWFMEREREREILKQPMTMGMKQVVGNWWPKELMEECLVFF